MCTDFKERYDVTPFLKLDRNVRDKLKIILTKADGYHIFERTIDDRRNIIRNSQGQRFFFYIRLKLINYTTSQVHQDSTYI